jgi:hypothetical protein
LPPELAVFRPEPAAVFRPEPAAVFRPEPAAVLLPGSAAFRPEPVLALLADPVALLADPVALLADPVALLADPVVLLADPAAFRLEPPAGLRPEPAAVLLPDPAAFLAELAAFASESAFLVFGDVVISILLATPAARGRLALLLAVPGEVPELLPGRLEHALGLVLGPALLHVSDQLRQRLLLLGDIQPVDGFGEPEVGIHAGDDDPRVYGQQLDAHQRNADIRVDDQPFVQDRVDHVGKTRR